MMQNKYLETIYNQENKPFSEYPKKLIKYLIKSANLKKNQKILELGCGRGDFISEFRNNGLDACGCDISNFSQNFFPDSFRMKNKWIRFSKEVMLLSFAKK